MKISILKDYFLSCIQISYLLWCIWFLVKIPFLTIYVRWHYFISLFFFLFFLSISIFFSPPLWLHPSFFIRQPLSLYFSLTFFHTLPLFPSKSTPISFKHFPIPSHLILCNPIQSNPIQRTIYKLESISNQCQYQCHIHSPAMTTSNLASLSTPTILFTSFSNPALVAAEQMPT